MILSALALCYGLGGYALMDPDEGRNAVIAQATAEGGSWLVPHFNGLPFLDKPFLYFATTAASMRVFGTSEWAVRLPSLLSTWATLALVVWFSRRLFGSDSGWLAGTAFATGLLTASYARALIFDSMLTFFATLSLVAFYLAIEDARCDKQRFWNLVAWGAIAGGTFTKGPVALLIPLLVAVPFAVWRRKIGRVFRPLGLLLFVALVAPWVVFTERAVPGFLHYALVTETWERLTTEKMQRTGPPWYFLPIMVGGAFPWSILVLSVGWSRFRQAMKSMARPSLVFLGLWILLPLIFFSLSQSKRIGYVLPLMPALSLLAAWAWTAAQSKQRSARLAAGGWLLLCVVFLWAGRSFVPKEPFAHLASSIPSTATVLGLVMLVTAVAGWLLADRRLLAPMVLSLPLVALPFIWASLLAEVSEIRSGKAMAVTAAPMLTASTVVFGVETYSPSFAFYLGRPLALCTANGSPLRSNYAIHLYPQIVGNQNPTLRPAEAWREALEACSQPYLFLLKTQYEDQRAVLSAAGVPVVYSDTKYTLMGPCQAPTRSAPDLDGAAALEPDASI